MSTNGSNETIEYIASYHYYKRAIAQFLIQSLYPHDDPLCYLVTQDTLEEHILARQEHKAALVGSIYSAAVRRKQSLFSEHDHAELLE